MSLCKEVMNLKRDEVYLIGERETRDSRWVSPLHGMLCSSSCCPPCCFSPKPKHATALDFWHLLFFIPGTFFSQIFTWLIPSLRLDVCSNVPLLKVTFLSSYLNGTSLSTFNLLLCCLIIS